MALGNVIVDPPLSCFLILSEPLVMSKVLNYLVFSQFQVADGDLPIVASHG